MYEMSDMGIEVGLQLQLGEHSSNSHVQGSRGCEARLSRDNIIDANQPLSIGSS
jgi:hypothetical protein